MNKLTLALFFISTVHWTIRLISSFHYEHSMDWSVLNKWAMTLAAILVNLILVPHAVVSKNGFGKTVKCVLVFWFILCGLITYFASGWWLFTGAILLGLYLWFFERTKTVPEPKTGKVYID